MKAAVIHGTKDVRIEEWPIKEVGTSEVKVEVEWAGICGSDLFLYSNFDAGLIPTKEPHPLTGGKAPLVLGHEFSGIVREIGKEVTNVKVGDRVAVEPVIACGKCRECREGNYQVCRESNSAFLGNAIDGGFAEYCVTDADKMHLLPDNVTLEEGALVEPAAVAYHGIIKSNLKPGQTVLVVGAGPIGLLTTQFAKAAGATKIFVSDVSKKRLAIAEEMGATHVLNPMEDNVIDIIMNETNQNGVDVSFEAAGVQVTLDTAVDATKKTGTILMLSLFGQNPEVNLSNVLLKELKIVAALAYANEFPQVIDMIASKRVDLLPVITNKIALENLVEDGIEKLINDKSEAKILVSMK